MNIFSLLLILCLAAVRQSLSFQHVVQKRVKTRLCNEEQQNGMEEAFASLEELTPDMLKESINTEYSSNLKYSRTDDTAATNIGKSSKEEVELYLEMQQEMEGSTIQEEEDIEQNTDIESLYTKEEEEEEEEEEVNDESSEKRDYPWSSINPILRLRGQVATGYGRGGKKLGVPTANLPSSLFQTALEDMSNGVYFGWAVIESKSTSNKGRNVPIKAVVNVGYSPTFEGKENKEKIVEAHLITKSSPMEKPESTNNEERSDNIMDEVEGDFYGETLRLQLIGYLRAEQKFDSFPELIAQIHRDIGNANWALDSMPFVFSKEDSFIKDEVEWVGSSGGDSSASWEYETW